MKILFLSGHYPPNVKGGGELSTHYLAQGIAAKGHELPVVTEGNKDEETDVEGVKVRRLLVDLTAKPLFEKKWARKCARQLAGAGVDFAEFDILHAHDFRSVQVLSELIKMGEVSRDKCIATVRDYAQICGSPNNLAGDFSECSGCETMSGAWNNLGVQEAAWPRNVFRWWQYWYNIGYRKECFRNLLRHVYISSRQREIVSARNDLSGVETDVIHNAVSEDFANASKGKMQRNSLVFIGTMQDYKGVQVVLEAFKEVAKRDSEVTLRLVGEGASLGAYKQFVEKEGLGYRVSFLGRVPADRLARLYDESEIVLAPGLWAEPFGRTVVEGMARGRTVIASRKGGPTETVADGKTGFLVEPGDVGQLADTIEKLFSMSHFDRQEIEKNAKQWVMDNLSSEKITEQYEEVYGKIA